MAMLIKITALLSTLAVISARPQGRQGYSAPQQGYQAAAQSQQYSGYSGNLQTAAQQLVPQQAGGAGMPYNFNWAVQAPEFGNDYSHTQQSDGRVTSGEYRVLLPDTRVQIVRFTADENGYVADVSYEGTAQYSSASNNVNNYARPQSNYQAQSPAPTANYAAQPSTTFSAAQPQSGYAAPSSTYGRR